MEARAQLRQPRMSKGLIAIVAVGVTFGLGVAAGTVANVNGTSGTTSQTHAIVYGKGGPAFESVRHGGVQTVEENAAPTVIRGVSPDAQDRKAGQQLVDAANSKYWVSAPKWFTPMASPTAAPTYYMPDGLGYRER
jgi:hypothetical protein